MTLTLTPLAEGEEVDCKGRYFRYVRSSFIGKNGRLVFTQELRPLKSISCPGCSDCGGQADDVAEGMSLDPHGLIEFDGQDHGDTVQLVFVEDARDWESDQVTAYHYKAVTVPKESA